MARTRGARAYGPYRHGRRWRVVIREPGGRKTSKSYGTEQYARQVVEEFNRATDGLTVAEAIDRYEQHLTAKGNKQRTIETARARLKPIRDTETLSRCRPAVRRRLDALEGSVDTRHNTLKQWRAFFRWCVKQHLIGRDPTEGMEVLGRRRKGKAQLTIDESRKLLDTCATAAAAGDDSAVAVMMALLLGLRATEISSMQIRGVDDDCSVIWIFDSKTEAGIRRVEVPPIMRPALEPLAKAKRERLFPGRDRHWVGYHVRRFCGLVGVPVVGPHGLRGTHATLATGAGATGHLVAAALGHEHEAVTQAHYIAPGATAAATQDRVLKVLSGGLR